MEIEFVGTEDIPVDLRDVLFRDNSTLERRYGERRDSQRNQIDRASRDYMVGCMDGAAALAREIWRECFGVESGAESIRPRDLIPLIKLMTRGDLIAAVSGVAKTQREVAEAQEG